MTWENNTFTDLGKQHFHMVEDTLRSFN